MPPRGRRHRARLPARRRGGLLLRRTRAARRVRTLTPPLRPDRLRRRVAVPASRARTSSRTRAGVLQVEGRALAPPLADVSRPRWRSRLPDGGHGGSSSLAKQAGEALPPIED